MKHLSSSITDFYIKRNIIKADEKEVYQYGVELILNEVITFGIILIYSTIAWKLRYAVEFLCVFCLTRVYCGGYHASKSYMCRLTMLGIFLSIHILSKILNDINPIWLFLILIICFAIIVLLVPVKHPNKTLTEKQIDKNRKIGIIIFLLFGIASFAVRGILGVQDGIIICLSLCAVTALAIIGTFTQQRRCHNEEIYR